MTTNRIISLKRISNDIREITNYPLEGIGIAPIDNDPMKYLVNIRLMTGIYEGYCLQLLLTFSDNYPTKPPKILIFPNQAISNITIIFFLIIQKMKKDIILKSSALIY